MASKIEIDKCQDLFTYCLFKSNIKSVNQSRFKILLRVVLGPFCLLLHKMPFEMAWNLGDIQIDSFSAFVSIMTEFFFISVSLFTIFFCVHHAQLVARLWTAGNCCVLEVQCKWLQWFGFQFHLLLNELSVKYFIHVSALPAVTAAKHTSEHEIRYSDCSHLRGVVRAVNAFSINWEPGSVHFNPLEINGKGKKCTDLIRSLYLSWISACTRLRMLP